MKNFILIALIALCNCHFSQVSYQYNYEDDFLGNKYSFFKLLINRDLSESTSITENISNSNFNDIINQNTSFNSDFILSSVCIHEENGSPIGLMINDYVKSNKLNLGDDVGNFYLKPNGALTISNDAIEIFESSNLPNLSNKKTAFQSGPMLLNNSIINSNFGQNSVNKKIRLAFGIVEKKSGVNFLVIAISREPVSFYDFANYFKLKHRATNALCIDSEGCKLYFSGFTAIQNDSLGAENFKHRYLKIKLD